MTAVERITWDQTWLAMAHVIARRSGCVRRQCGAVIVDKTNRIVATGYNGPPAGLMRGGRDAACETDCERAQATAGPPATYDNCFSIHAEANALMFCDRRARQGGTIYVTSAVCFSCAKLIANSGLTRVVMKVLPEDTHRQPKRSVSFLQSSGLVVEAIYQEVKD